MQWQDEYFWGFKQAKRRDDDIAIVNAGMFVRFEVETNTIQKISLAFGGMGTCTICNVFFSLTTF